MTRARPMRTMILLESRKKPMHIDEHNLHKSPEPDIV